MSNCGTPSTTSFSSLGSELSVATKETLIFLTSNDCRLSNLAYPIAHRILPQLASCPYKAVLTNIEFEIDSAMIFASAKCNAFLTFTVTNFVAPSPSRTTNWANCCANSVTCCCTCGKYS
ncbi:hypothetical protein KMAR_60181 [Kluyveromyces marxianus]|nr:hypothetical protein KMAR_60181 [Kluyveromyces marxianus]